MYPGQRKVKPAKFRYRKSKWIQFFFIPETTLLNLHTLSGKDQHKIWYNWWRSISCLSNHSPHSLRQFCPLKLHPETSRFFWRGEAHVTFYFVYFLWPLLMLFFLADERRKEHKKREEEEDGGWGELELRRLLRWNHFPKFSETKLIA